MELTLIGIIAFFTIKGILSLIVILWTGKKIKRFIRKEENV